MPLPKRFAAELRHPLNLAALLTWATVAFDVVSRAVKTGDAWTVAAAAALLVVYMGAFTVHAVVDCSRQRVLLYALFAIQAVAMLGLMLIGPTYSVLVLAVIVIAQVAPHSTLRGTLGFALAMNAAVYVVLAYYWRIPNPVVTLLLYLGFQAFSALTSWYAFRAESARDEIAQINAQLIATRSLLADSARDQERLRLARELHDVAGHKLTALKLNLTALARQPNAAPEVALAAQLADELLGDIRAVVREMRATDGIDLATAIRALAAPLPQVAVHVAVETSVDSVTQAETLVRAAQEALTNAVRHAGAANVWIVVRRDQLEGKAGRVHLDVRDDGRGGGAIRFGNGLTGMRERFEAHGGGLDVARAEHGGLTLHGWIPA